MKKQKTVNFQFLSDDRKLATCFAGGKPAFYIPQPVGSWNGIIIDDMKSAERLKQVAEAAIKHFKEKEQV